jgi:hypothetical protein
MRMMLKFRERHSCRKYPLRSILKRRDKAALSVSKTLNNPVQNKIKRNKQGNFIKFAGRNTNRNERYTGYNHHES